MMPSILRSFVYCSILSVLGASRVFAANPCDEFERVKLDEAGRAKVERGETVAYFVDAKGPWPKIFVFRKVPGTAKEAMAMFSDINHQKKYFPNLKDSRVLSRPTRNTAIGQFEIHLSWPMPNERFKMNVESYEYPDFYESRGTTYDGSLISSGEVCARFEKGQGQVSVLAYYSYITSDHALAGQATGRVKKMTVELGQKFSDELDRIKKVDPQLLARQTADLDTSLGSGLFSEPLFSELR